MTHASTVSVSAPSNVLTRSRVSVTETPAEMLRIRAICSSVASPAAMITASPIAALVVAATLTFQIEGVPKLIRMINRATDASAKRTQGVLLKSAKWLRNKVRQVTPVGKLQLKEATFTSARTGKTIKRSFGGSGKLKQAVIATTFKSQPIDSPAAFVKLDYRISEVGHLVEYGHGGPQPAPPHPFFRPAIDEHGTRAIKQATDDLAKMLEKAMKR